ncbi:MAG: F0F1 ATP synthase subunit beta, partial [Firmicutes bacterium]|nr:F0F1 ATP synthase subunit beta [Bacillota bacterium]
MAQGIIREIIGPVVDVEFPAGELPDIYNAVTVTSLGQQDEDSLFNINITMEAMQHLGNNSVRCVALSSTDGLRRGMLANDTGSPIKITVGRPTLGRMLNVIGEPIDGLGDLPAGEKLPIHRPAP